MAEMHQISEKEQEEVRKDFHKSMGETSLSRWATHMFEFFWIYPLVVTSIHFYVANIPSRQLTVLA